jgi:glycosyltransferase involved in cell wall biosynthesis
VSLEQLKHPPPTRILYPFVGDSIGGAQISGTTLSRNLNTERFEAKLLLHENGSFASYLKKKGIRFRIMPLHSYVGRQTNTLAILAVMITTFPRLYIYLIRNKISIIHCQDSRMNLTWMLPAKLARIPLVWHQRSKFPNSRLMRIIAKFANQIICISQYTFSTLPDTLKSNSLVIGNPVELQDGRPDKIESKKNLHKVVDIPVTQDVIGIFGNLTTQKRPSTVIKIASEFAKTKKYLPAFVFFGADRDNQQLELEKMAKDYNVDHCIYFMGFVPDPEHWMAGCDVVIALGVDEAFGRTVAEAMLVGTPVVASDLAGHREIISHGETGYLVPSDNAPEFRHTIEIILDDKNIGKKLSDRAAESITRRYSIQAHVEQVVRIYDNLHSGKRRTAK